MGFYRDQVVPRLVELACASPAISAWRAEACEGMGGRVVEIGFGSGLNVGLYPSAVAEVLAVEPAAVARRLATKRVARSTVPITHVGLDGQSIPLEDESCDAALSTFTLCTIPEPGRALAELLRVLRPGGRLHFLEHGLATEEAVAAWQRRLEPWQRRLADGCHLTRQPATLVRDAGFVVERLNEGYARGPKPWSWFSVGIATKPGQPAPSRTDGDEARRQT